jgi:hypothetical protein
LKAGEAPKRIGGLITAPIRRLLINWGKRRVMRQLDRELQEYAYPPEVGLGRLKRGRRGTPEQTFRGFIQVNFFPRERASPPSSVWPRAGRSD